jgi:hypothetical protein
MNDRQTVENIKIYGVSNKDCPLSRAKTTKFSKKTRSYLDSMTININTLELFDLNNECDD